MPICRKYCDTGRLLFVTLKFLCGNAGLSCASTDRADRSSSAISLFMRGLACCLGDGSSHSTAYNSEKIGPQKHASLSEAVAQPSYERQSENRVRQQRTIKVRADLATAGANNDALGVPLATARAGVLWVRSVAVPSYLGYSGRAHMKLVLRVALGILFAVAVVAGGVYSYNWYKNRSTANEYERAAAASFMDTVSQTCYAISSPEKCTAVVFDSCKQFHLNQSDCTEMFENALKQAKAKTVDGTPPNDADELVIRCGKPYKEDSTAYDSPRPPIVTRFLEYKVKGTHLKFIYVPGNGHVGDPPPYDWKLQMVANVRTNKLFSRDQVSSLMPCTASVPAPRISTPPN
jgi:hypothetical protein